MHAENRLKNKRLKALKKDIRGQLNNIQKLVSVGELSPKTANFIQAVLKESGSNLRILVQENVTLKSRVGRDTATKLFDRVSFMAALRRQINAMADGWSAVLMIDVDNFKSINDTQGHSTGDKVIAWLAKIIRKNIRAGDVWARYGGDEFVALLKDFPNLDAVHAAANRLRAEVRGADWKKLGVNTTLGISVGATIFSAKSLHGDHDMRRIEKSCVACNGASRIAAQIMKLADHEMYVDKARKNREDRPAMPVSCVCN